MIAIEDTVWYDNTVDYNRSPEVYYATRSNPVPKEVDMLQIRSVCLSLNPYQRLQVDNFNKESIMLMKNLKTGKQEPTMMTIHSLTIK